MEGGLSSSTFEAMNKEMAVRLSKRSPFLELFLLASINLSKMDIAKARVDLFSLIYAPYLYIQSTTAALSDCLMKGVSLVSESSSSSRMELLSYEQEFLKYPMTCSSNRIIC
jgi:hypothetical protein